MVGGEEGGREGKDKQLGHYVDIYSIWCLFQQYKPDKKQQGIV